MPIAVLSNFLIYCVANAFTPGPGNILALNTVTNYGYKKGKPLFFGIFAGYYVVQIICAIFVYGVNSLLPNVMEVMKYIGAAYILWLSIHIAFSKKTSENTEQSASFLKGFMLQFVNVKIYMFGVTRKAGWLLQGLSCLPEVGALRHPGRCHGNCRQNARCGCAGVRNTRLLLLRQRSAQDDAGLCQPIVR